MCGHAIQLSAFSCQCRGVGAGLMLSCLLLLQRFKGRFELVSAPTGLGEERVTTADPGWPSHQVVVEQMLRHRSLDGFR